LENCRRILPVITKKLRTLLIARENIPALFYLLEFFERLSLLTGAGKTCATLTEGDEKHPPLLPRKK